MDQPLLDATVSLPGTGDDQAGLVMNTLSRPMSDRLRRLHEEAVAYDDDAAQQSTQFLRLCVQEGYSDDAIVCFARKHMPSRRLGENNLDTHVDVSQVDRGVQHRLVRIREETRGAPETGPFLDWRSDTSALGAADYCIPELVRRGDSVSIIGPPKSGKSLLVLDMVASKATGRPFLGTEAPAGPTVYWDCENRPAEVLARLDALGFSRRDLADLKYVSFPQNPRLDTPDGAGEAIRLVEAAGAELFVIDTLQRVLGGDEESSTGIRAMYVNLVMPLRRKNVAVLRVDHVGKNISRGPRGSSAKLDDVDESYQLTSNRDGLLQLRKTLSRYAPGDDDLCIRLESSPLRHVRVEDDLERRPMAADREDTSGESSTISELVQKLDDLGIPDDVGRPTCARELQAAGIKYRTNELAAAVKHRKDRTAT